MSNNVKYGEDSEHVYDLKTVLVHSIGNEFVELWCFSFG
jgi:hypothetical protein